MNHVVGLLLERKSYLEKLRKSIRKELKELPEGRLRVSREKGIPRYYWLNDVGESKMRYIKKNEVGLVHGLAQRDYLLRLQQKVEQELMDIDNYLLNNPERNLESVYESLNEYRKNLVEPLVITDEAFVEQWKSEEYITNTFCEEQKVYSTKNNEFVRSKSELMIADMYYEMGVPYRYEAALRLKNGKVRYPDFTILNVRTREIIYHEHFGLMDDEEYCMKNYEKIVEYAENGIYQGKNLIVTYEAERCYLNIKDIRKMMETVLVR